MPLFFKIIMFILISSHFSVGALAEIQVKVFSPNRNALPLLVAIPRGEPSPRRLKRYLKLMQQDAELAPFAAGLNSDWYQGKFSDLPDRYEFSRPSVVLVANELYDMNGGQRMKEVGDRFRALGADVYMLPIAMGVVGFSNVEQRQFHRALSQKIDALISVGGDDLDPEATYGEKNKYAQNTNAKRDRAEAALVRDYIIENQGVFVGFCRGHQLCATVFNHKLVQDIPREITADADHQRWHQVELLPVRESLLRNSFPGKDSVFMLSWHHQSVKANPESLLVVTATSGKGEGTVIEAFQGRDVERMPVFTFQSHPELMRNQTGEVILQKLMDEIIKKRQHVLHSGACRLTDVMRQLRR